MDRKCLYWISDADTIHDDPIDMKLVGSVSINDEVIFANNKKYKKFSPLFCYTSKLSSKSHPTYFNNSLFKDCSGIWGISKYNHYCIVGTVKRGSKYLHTLNKKTGTSFPVSFDMCCYDQTNRPLCKNKKCRCHLETKHKRNKRSSKSIINELVNIVGYDEDHLVDFEIIDGSNYFVFAFIDNDELVLALINFESDCNKIMMNKKNVNVFKYDMSDAVFVGMTHRKNELVILTNAKEGDESIIYTVRWYKTLGSLGFMMEKVKRVNRRYLSIGTTKNKILLTYADSQNSTGFSYDLL